MTGPAWAGAAYAAASAVALLLHGIDKAAAARGGRRVCERTLHLVELAGGWPGGMAASALLRHKTRKASFLLVRAGTVLLHAAGWAWWLGWIPRP